MKFIQCLLELLGIIKLPVSDSRFAYLSGSNLFPQDNLDYAMLEGMLKAFKVPVIRMPMPFANNQWLEFARRVNFLTTKGISSLILIDCVDSEKDGLQRIDFINAHCIKPYSIEFFNERPTMPYPGLQFTCLKDLMDCHNRFAYFVKRTMINVPILHMAPLNILVDYQLDSNWGYSNRNQYSELAKWCYSDISSCHLYADNKTKPSSFQDTKDLIEKVRSSYNKPTWITETGDSLPSNHIYFFNTWIARIAEHYRPEKILWYRQEIEDRGRGDGGFALTSEHSAMSPLWSKLISK